jgi:tetratricopeptide (TPR) repeat protein
MRSLKSISNKLLIIAYLQFILIFALKPLIANFINVRADYYAEFASKKKAIRLYKRALFLDKKNIYALIWAGYVYEDLGENDIAENYYQKAIQYNPNKDMGYYFLAILKMRKKEYKKAYKLLSQSKALQGSYYKETLQFLKSLNKKSGFID